MKKLVHYIETHPHRARSLLGTEHQQLSRLVAYLQQLAATDKAQQNAGKIRLNGAGAGRPASLSTETEILLCLYYLRHYPTFEVLGLAFEVSSGHAHAVVQYWLKYLRQALPASVYEEFGECEVAWSVIEAMLVEWELIVDSTE